MQKNLIFHAAPEMRVHIAGGQHHFANMLAQIFAARGCGMRVAAIGRAALWRAKLDRNFHIFDMDGAVGPRALNMRPSVLQPFWALERPHSRYQGRMAHKVFDPSTVGGGLVTPFFEEMQGLYLSADQPDVEERIMCWCRCKASLASSVPGNMRLCRKWCKPFARRIRRGKSF